MNRISSYLTAKPIQTTMQRNLVSCYFRRFEVEKFVVCIVDMLFPLYYLKKKLHLWICVWFSRCLQEALCAWRTHVMFIGIKDTCSPFSDRIGSLGAVGSINISNILTGKCLAKIRADDPSVVICPLSRPNSSNIRSSVQEALEDVTALFYDEERNEIYTGNRHGLVHVWSN